jgi:spore photoproduct lyase
MRDFDYYDMIIKVMKIMTGKKIKQDVGNPARPFAGKRRRILADLFSADAPRFDPPMGHAPVRPDHFEVDRIFFSKGSRTDSDRIRFADGICNLYPEAEVIDCQTIPHNQIELGEKDPTVRNAKGKRSLVFGEHRSAVRFSDEAGNTCPNYWHFSPYGFCFYGCKYCYLAGTPGVWHSPTIKIFVNLEEIIHEIDRTANRLAAPTAFYLGKLQDGLALDPLTGYSEILVPFFARHKFARQVILTKSDEVERLLKLDHQGHTILSWSLNPPEITKLFESNAPSVENRIKAMKNCAEKGFPVRAVIMPMIPVGNWQDYYSAFIKRLLERVPLSRLTIGGICIYKNARKLMEHKLGAENPISTNIDRGSDLKDGRARYAEDNRLEMYSHIIDIARQVRPDLELALCLEGPQVWEAVGLRASMGHCNCGL